MVYIYLYSTPVCREMSFTIHYFRFLCFVCASTCLLSQVYSTTTVTDKLSKGYTISPDSSVATFQPILTDSNANYSLGLLRVNRTQLALVILHTQSSQQLWIANTNTTTSTPPWSSSTRVIFNGSLVILSSNKHSTTYWSTNTINGDSVHLSNTSNLQINDPDSIMIWQSFDFPSDTLVENQKFSSNMTLFSSNGLYYMHLGYNYIGLYARFNKQSGGPDQIYYKHKAMEIKAKIIPGQGLIYATISPDGFLGMYQNDTAPIDIQSFSSFQQLSNGRRRLKLESDGSLKGYYWTGSDWVLDYQAISEFCELPSPCGAYGLCHRGKGCSCLINNQTEQHPSGKCESPEDNSGDFCGLRSGKYKVVKPNGVELPFKEQMEYEKMNSLEECEKSCDDKCGCWGAVYSNSSGFCYRVEYPIQTLVGVGDNTKVGYIKVRVSAGENKTAIGLGVGAVLLCGVVLIFVSVLLVMRRRRTRKRGVSESYIDQDGGVGGGVGPYKDLASSSFGSVELSQRI